MLLLILFLHKEFYAAGDLKYFFQEVTTKPFQTALIEYPTPLLIFIEFLVFLSFRSFNSFIVLFVLLMLLAEGLVTLYLWRHHYRRAAVYWSTFLFFIGPLMWMRLDLLSTIPVTLSLVFFASTPTLSGVMIALGASTKLWPAILISPMAGTNRNSHQRLLGFFSFGLLLGIWSLLFFGWQRSASPLTWQSDRGLQVESIPATWVMLRRLDPTSGYTVKFSEFNAWEIYGPLVPTFLTIAKIVMIGVIIVAVVLCWIIGFGGYGLPGRTLDIVRKGYDNPERQFTIAVTLVALIAWLIVANKTFSPQYTIWLAGPLAIVISVAYSTRAKIHSCILGVLGLVIAALTHAIFPLFYGYILNLGDYTLAMTVVLVLRNLLVITLAIYSLVIAIQTALHPTDTAELEGADCADMTDHTKELP